MRALLLLLLLLLSLLLLLLVDPPGMHTSSNLQVHAQAEAVQQRDDPRAPAQQLLQDADITPWPTACCCSSFCCLRRILCRPPCCHDSSR
jgi:hypothetical protein